MSGPEGWKSQVNHFKREFSYQFNGLLETLYWSLWTERLPWQKAVLVAFWLGAIGGLHWASLGVWRNVEGFDDACMACHLEGHKRLVTEASQGAKAETMAAFHTEKGVRCIDCHAQPGLIGQQESFLRGLGHIARTATGKFQRPVTVPHPRFAINCQGCHNLDELLGEFKGTFHGRDIHNFLAPPNTCDACHIGHTAGKTGKSFETFMLDACHNCHPQLSR